MKVLLLEDDYLYRVSIKDFLLANGYEVDDVEDGTEALEMIYADKYAVLLMDIRVPGMDGYSLLKKIREDKIYTPVIMLTSLTDIEDLSLGYELGCNDYLRKPFELKELEYRLKHVIEQDLFRADSGIVKIDGRYSFDISREVLYRDGKDIDLSSIESKLVSYLIRNKGFYISLDELQENVWEGKDVTYADIRMCIKRTREKSDKEFIKTKKMVGYRIG
jgi:DNA-binding response OmpR family regulator